MSGIRELAVHGRAVQRRPGSAGAAANTSNTNTNPNPNANTNGGVTIAWGSNTTLSPTHATTHSPTPASPASPHGSMLSSGVGGSGGVAGSSHPPSPIALTRFNPALCLQAFGPSPLMIGSAAGSGNVAGGGGKFQVIARPLASRVGSSGLGAAFQHSLHPTAVQASHALGQANKSGGGSSTTPTAMTGNVNNNNTNNGALRSPSASPSPSLSLSLNLTGSSIGVDRPPSGTGSGSNSGGTSPSIRDRIARNNRYGTFPRLGSRGSPNSTTGAGLPDSPSGSNPGGRSSASPARLHGRSPELSSSQSVLHPRSPANGPYRGSGAHSKAGRTNTPPHSNKKKGSAGPSRRNSADVVDGELRHSMADMDLTDEVSPTSGYSSDASTLSMDSHASTFPSAALEATTGLVYGSRLVPPPGADVTAHVEDEDELIDAQGEGPSGAASRLAQPPSPLHLRAGAPLPHKMYGMPTPKSQCGSGQATPLARSLPQSRGSAMMMDGGGQPSSAESSALQSPLLDPLSFPAPAVPPRGASGLGLNLALGLAHPPTPTSPVPPLDSSIPIDSNSTHHHSLSANGAPPTPTPTHKHPLSSPSATNAAAAQAAAALLNVTHDKSTQPYHLQSLGNAEIPPSRIDSCTPPALPNNISSPPPPPKGFTTIPALDLPRSSTRSPRSPHDAAAALAGIVPPLPIADVPLPGCSSAFSTARSQTSSSLTSGSVTQRSSHSLLHSTSGTSLPGTSSESEACGMDWTASSVTPTLTARSNISGCDSNTSSTTDLHANTMFANQRINIQPAHVMPVTQH